MIRALGFMWRFRIHGDKLLLGGKLLTVFVYLLLFIFEAGFPYVALDSLELTVWISAVWNG